MWRKLPERRSQASYADEQSNRQASGLGRPLLRAKTDRLCTIVSFDSVARFRDSEPSKPCAEALAGATRRANRPPLKKRSEWRIFYFRLYSAALYVYFCVYLNCFAAGIARPTAMTCGGCRLDRPLQCDPCIRAERRDVTPKRGITTPASERPDASASEPQPKGQTMGTIRVEYVPVQRFGLGLLGFDHLHLVYEDETSVLDTQDFWFVLEGIQDGLVFGGTLGALGEDGSTTLAAANGANRDDLIAKIGTPEDRGSRILATGPSLINTWNQMAGYGGDIQDQLLPYIAFSLPLSASPTINSTSFIASVLWSVGIDLSLVAPFGIRNSPGASTLIGSSEADDLSIVASFTTLVSGTGDDQLRGSSNLVFIERFYGGEGNDTIYWSRGDNIIHGGQTRLAYGSDGLDTIDYSGAGRVLVTANRYALDHKISDHISYFDGGKDNLFSIEQIAWDRKNDVIIAGEGVSFLERPVLLDLKGSEGGRGDQLGFSGSSVPLIINAVDSTTLSIQTQSNSGLDAGYWALSVETLAGSDGDDLIYAGAGVLSVDGGDGDDVIDGRLSAAFSGQSENGYDVELFGGDGDDTLVSGSGRTLAIGGAGADVFVLSAMTTTDDTVEFVIENADADDTLYLPYDFFQAQRGEFDGSTLLQVSGAPFKIDEVNTQSFFLWGNPGPSFDVYEFVGAIQFTMDGSDLLIKPVQGTIEEFTQDNGPGEPPGPTMTFFVGEAFTEATIRVRDWSEGILGINFPLTFDLTELGLDDDFYDYPGLRSAIADAISPSRFLAPLTERPEAYTPLEIANALSATSSTLSRSFAALAEPATTVGGDGDDILTSDDAGPYTFRGFGGNDDITGSRGGDVIDGGSGADTMRGQRGNDAYYVDHIGDMLIEGAGGGFDRVIATIDYALGDFVEHLELAGAATSATGNALNNKLIGNDLNNVLTGGDGDDIIAGNAGDDVLIGGNGGDAYAYELGDGNDVIIDANDPAGGSASADDVLVLLGSITPGDVTLIRNPNAMGDLVLAFADGGRITIKDYYAGTGAGIDAITFEAGDTWSTAEIASRAEAAIVTSNFAPVARDDAYVTSGGAIVTIARAALLANDTDADNDVLVITAVDGVSGGTATITQTGDIEIQPDAVGTPSSVSFTYTISDGRAGSSRATAEIALTATPLNAPPEIVSITLAPAIEDQAAMGAVVARDSNGDPLTFAIKPGAAATKGTISVSADGSLVFTPFANANGTDQFTITVSDGKSPALEQQFAFTIAPVNDAPTGADDDLGSVVAGQTVSLAAGRILANDRDIDGDTISIVAVRDAVGGTVALSASGDVVFSANANFSGAASFVYDIADGQGGTANAAVSLSVTPPATDNAAPVIRAASLPQVREDHDVKGRIIASDADGDTLTYAVKSGSEPMLGTVSIGSDGRLTYRPDPNANGAEAFVIAVSDGRGAATDVPFSFTIRSVNDAPVAIDDIGASMRAGTSQSFSEQSLLANDRDIDGDALNIVSVSHAVGGSVHLTRDGDIVFTAHRGYRGEAQFSYRVSDGNGGSDVATVTFDVTREHGLFNWNDGWRSPLDHLLGHTLDFGQGLAASNSAYANGSMNLAVAVRSSGIDFDYFV